METGFLNPIQDEEHFPFYSGDHGLDESEHILFGEMIVPEVMDYDSLWQGSDLNDSTQAEHSDSQFQRMLYEMQHQLTCMQEPEVIQQILPVKEPVSQSMSALFSSLPTSPILGHASAIDELFAMDLCKGSPLMETSQEVREEDATITNETVLKDDIKEEIQETPDCQRGSEDVSSIPVFDEVCRGEVDKIEISNEISVEDDPLLIGGDLTSLLEQFEEVSEHVTYEQPPTPSPPRPTNQTIREALPEEVINRIKASRQNHKKLVAVIPAIPNKKLGRAATRMQDAGAALSRNKILKLVTGGSSGESVQLDHDYCTTGEVTNSSSKSCYLSDSSDYPSQSSTPEATYSRLPEYYSVLAPQRQAAADNGSRKDSGMESGDYSEEDNKSGCELKHTIILKTSTGLHSVNVGHKKHVIVSKTPSIRTTMPMVSLLKKNNIKLENSEPLLNSSAINLVNSENSSVPATDSSKVDLVDVREVGRKKRKLNLEEYRVRREERERIRSEESSRTNSPVPCSTPPVQSNSTTICAKYGVLKEKPLMQSVEVQTQTCEIIDLTSGSPPGKSCATIKESRTESKRKGYLKRQESSSCSSSSAESERHHRRTKRRSRSDKRRRSSVSRMWSRSRSRSSSRSRSHSRHSSHSRSRSRSHDSRKKWRSRSPYRSTPHYSNSSYHTRDGSWQRRHSPVRRHEEFGVREKVLQVEERRVIYVGRINEGTSKADLRRRFQQFGPIVDISVHFRERGDNYGFVTFAYKADAYKAVEHGNDDRTQPRYDLCFGGRRAFCKQRYADLDGIATNCQQRQYTSPRSVQRPDDSFDSLLHEVKAQLRKRSSV